jgi:hypothetical protein
MTTRRDLVPVAAYLATVGGSFAVLAGVVQATVGSRIPEWTGAKGQPVALGMLTIALGLTVVAAGRVLRSSSAPPSETLTAVTLWLVVVAIVCSTTVGRMWFVPGVLLIGGACCTFAACGWRALRRVVVERWLRGLLGVLGAFELLMAVSAAPATNLAAGLVGGAALIMAAVLGRPGRRTAVLLLVASTLVFVALTWWTIVTPLLTLVALSLGVAVTHRRPRSDAGALAALR